MKCINCNINEATPEEIICEDCFIAIIEEVEEKNFYLRELENGYKHHNGPVNE
jgi:hypothetical protein